MVFILLGITKSSGGDWTAKSIVPRVSGETSAESVPGLIMLEVNVSAI